MIGTCTSHTLGVVTLGAVVGLGVTGGCVVGCVDTTGVGLVFGTCGVVCIGWLGLGIGVCIGCHDACVYPDCVP